MGREREKETAVSYMSAMVDLKASSRGRSWRDCEGKSKADARCPGTAWEDWATVEQQGTSRAGKVMRLGTTSTVE